MSVRYFQIPEVSLNIGSIQPFVHYPEGSRSAVMVVRGVASIRLREIDYQYRSHQGRRRLFTGIYVENFFAAGKRNPTSSRRLVPLV